MGIEEGTITTWQLQLLRSLAGGLGEVTVPCTKDSRGFHYPVTGAGATHHPVTGTAHASPRHLRLTGINTGYLPCRRLAGEGVGLPELEAEALALQEQPEGLAHLGRLLLQHHRRLLHLPEQGGRGRGRRGEKGRVA